MQASAAPELRPLSIGEILDVAIKIYLRNAWTLFRVVLVVVAPVQIVSALIEASAASNGDTTTVSSHDIDNGQPGFGPGDQFASHDVLKQNGKKRGSRWNI